MNTEIMCSHSNLLHLTAGILLLLDSIEISREEKKPLNQRIRKLFESFKFTFFMFYQNMTLF